MDQHCVVENHNLLISFLESFVSFVFVKQGEGLHQRRKLQVMKHFHYQGNCANHFVLVACYHLSCKRNIMLSTNYSHIDQMQIPIKLTMVPSLLHSVGKNCAKQRGPLLQYNTWEYQSVDLSLRQETYFLQFQTSLQSKLFLSYVLN